MKILMFGWEYPPYNSGGLGVACQGIARSLASNGMEIIFVLPKKINTHEDRVKFIFADIPEITAKAFNSLLTAYTTTDRYYNLRNKIHSKLYGAGLFDEVERYSMFAEEIAKNNSFDIIHAHDWLSFGAGIVAKKVSNKPLVIHYHSTELDRGGPTINESVYAREKEASEAADKIVTVSDFTKNLLTNHYEAKSEKIEVVHNSIDTTSYNLHSPPDNALTTLKKEGYKIVLFVGRLTLQKGPDYFLKAAKIALEYDDKIMFAIVGSGDMEGQLMQESALLGISDNVIFMGFLRGKALSQAYVAADLFVMPSVSEPFGLVALESVAHGTPVIISKQSGVAESLSHTLKVDFWDTEDLADKILSVLEYKSMHKVLINNSTQELKATNWDTAAKKLIGIYNHV